MKSSPLEVSRAAKRKLGGGKVSQPVACGRDGSADSDEQPLRWQAVAGHGSANGSGIDSAIGYGGGWRAGQSSECVRNWRAEHATRSDVEIHRPRASSFESGAHGRNLANEIGRASCRERV